MNNKLSEAQTVNDESEEMKKDMRVSELRKHDNNRFHFLSTIV